VSDRPRLLATLEGYAVEGGFDRAHEPATCYLPTIALGRHAGPGDADDLWRDYERVIDHVPALGLDGVRLSVEWARVEPRRGVIDTGALERYRDIARYARSLGLHVTVALVDAVWPSWLGLEAWLLPWVVPYVVAHATRVVTFLGDDASGVVVFANPDAFVTGGYLQGSAPPWRRGARDDASSARAQIAVVCREVAATVVGAKIVAATRTIDLDRSPDEVRAQRAGGAHCQEIYVRSLVQGAGPTGGPAGLLVRRAGQWTLGVGEELLAALR
jgi:beta-glucosidase/6-phospho-beta-glucosidase/beta-galactosidase